MFGKGGGGGMGGVGGGLGGTSCATEYGELFIWYPENVNLNLSHVP